MYSMKAVLTSSVCMFALMGSVALVGTTATSSFAATSDVASSESLDVAASGLPAKDAPFDQTVAYFLWPYQYGTQNNGTDAAPQQGELQVDRSSTADASLSETASGNSQAEAAATPMTESQGDLAAGEYGWKGPGTRPTEPNLKSLDAQIKQVKESGMKYVKTSYLISPLNAANAENCDQTVLGSCQPSTELPDLVIQRILDAGLKPVIYFSQGNPDAAVQVKDPKTGKVINARENGNGSALKDGDLDAAYMTVPSFTKQQVKDTISHAIEKFANKGVIWESFNEPESDEHWPGGNIAEEQPKQWIELNQFIGDTIQKYNNAENRKYVYGNFSGSGKLKNFTEQIKAAHATAISGHGYWVDSPENAGGVLDLGYDYMDSEFGCSAGNTETSWSCGFSKIPKDSELQGIWLSRELLVKDIKGVSLSSPYRMVGYDSFSINEDNDPKNPGNVKETKAFQIIKDLTLNLQGYSYVQDSYKSDDGVWSALYKNSAGDKKLVYWAIDKPTMDTKGQTKEFTTTVDGQTLNLTAKAMPQVQTISSQSESNTVLTNLTAWKDTQGNVIQAHGGSVLKEGDTFYWVGQGAPDNVPTGYTGAGGVFKNQWLYTTINMYKSKDLVNWQFDNAVTSIDDANAAEYCNGNVDGLTSKVLDYNSSDPAFQKLVAEHPQYKSNQALGCKIERPHILKNAKTGKFLIWAHWEGTVGYGSSQLIAFQSDTVDGKYQPLEWTNGDGSKVKGGHAQPIVKVDGKLTPTASRDLSVWQDPDTQEGYIISSTEKVRLYKLNDTFTGIQADGSYQLPNISYREAPSLFKENGRYYMITSAQDYWNPTQTEYASTTNLNDPNGWSKLTELQSRAEARKNWGNQDSATRTYIGQPTYVLQYTDAENKPAVMLLADDWNPLKADTADVDTTKANYVLTPVQRQSNAKLAAPFQRTVTPNPKIGDDQTPRNGWNADKSRWYDNGVMARNHAFFDPGSGAWYWADADGSIATDKDVFIPKDESNRSKGGKWVRFDKDRHMVKGEDFRYGGWYYFDQTTGAMAKGVTYVASNGGKWVYYDTVNGKMAYGERFLNYDSNHTGWYYFDQTTGAMAHADVFVHSNGGKWVRYNHVTGKMVKGLQRQSGSWYYFDQTTGAMAHGNAWVPEWDTWHWFDQVTGRG